MSKRDTSSYEHAPPDWCLARAIAAYGVAQFCERYHAITGVRLVPLPDDAVPAFGPDGEPIQHQGPAIALRAAEQRHARLDERGAWGLYKGYARIFPNYAWSDAETAADLLVAEILTLRTELNALRAAEQDAARQTARQRAHEFMDRWHPHDMPGRDQMVDALELSFKEHARKDVDQDGLQLHQQEDLCECGHPRSSHFINYASGPCCLDCGSRNEHGFSSARRRVMSDEYERYGKE
jgi:hypothetical protein